MLAGLGVRGIARLPTAFIPVEDQGYVLIGVQLPDGASLERTREAVAETSRIARATPGVGQVIEIAGVSVLDNNASLPNAGVAYVILKDWGERGQAGGEDLRSLYAALSAALDALPQADAFVVVPPPIQGIGNASGFTMEVELRDGSFDFEKLERTTRAVRDRGRGDPVGPAASRQPLPRGRPADPADGGQRAGGGARRAGRRRLRRPRRLSRLGLRQPVQPLRPDLPGLRPGGLGVPTPAGGHCTLSFANWPKSS